MIQEHVQHIHHAIDEKSLGLRVLIAVLALVSVPLLGTGIRHLGSTLGLGRWTLPLLVLAHVPAVVALIAAWSVGCDVCR